MQGSVSRVMMVNIQISGLKRLKRDQIDKILTIKRIGVTMIMKTRIFDRSRSLGTLHSTQGWPSHVCSRDQPRLTRCCMDPGTDTHISQRMGRAPDWSIHRIEGSDWSLAVERPLIGRWWHGCHALGATLSQLRSCCLTPSECSDCEREVTSIVTSIVTSHGGMEQQDEAVCRGHAVPADKDPAGPGVHRGGQIKVLRDLYCDPKVFCFRTGMRGSWWTAPPVSLAGISSVKCIQRCILYSRLIFNLNILIGQ